jgi:sulfite reductase (ferredoxin)
LVSEESGVGQQEVFDTTPYAMSLTTKLIAEADSYLLPRKLKIAFSSNDEQIDYAGVNDLGLVAKIQNGVKGFRVYVGGGGGSNPSVGWLLFDFMPASELYIVAEALKKMFSEHGNRKNKHKARIRYIFYRLGETETIRLIKEYYEAAKQTAPLLALEGYEAETLPVGYAAPKGLSIDAGFETWRTRYAANQTQYGFSTVLAPFVFGNLPLDDEKWTAAFVKLLQFVSQFGKHTIRFTTTQNVRLRNIPTIALPELYLLLKTVVADTNAPLLVNNIVSCTGADTCRLGVALSKGLAAAIRKALVKSSLDLERLSTTRIHISGCPNSCGQQIWADIGFAGKTLRNDRIYPGYLVYLAANRSDSPRLAEPVGNISARDIPAFTVRLLAAYIEQQSAYPSLTAWLESDGKKYAVSLLAEYENVPEFAEDKNYYFDWGADSIFSVIGRGAAECSAGLFDMIDLDLNKITAAREALETETAPQAVNRLLYEVVYSASRMLLVTRGLEPKTTEDVFDMFQKSFIDAGLVGKEYRNIVKSAATAGNVQETNLSTVDFISRKAEVYALADAVIDLYKNMDDSLQFKTEKPAEVKPKTDRRFKDLRGVLCPMNFVQTKIQLSTMQFGDELEIWLDDGQPIINVPGSVRGEGHEVLEQVRAGEYWKVVIRK